MAARAQRVALKAPELDTKSKPEPTPEDDAGEGRPPITACVLPGDQGGYSPQGDAAAARSMLVTPSARRSRSISPPIE